MTADRITIERELELIDGMIEVQLHHARQCDGIANRAMAEKQKGWDMERVALLRKMRAALVAQPAEPVAQEPVAWLWRLNHSGKAFLMVADSTLRESLTDAFPVYAAPAAVPLTDEQFADIVADASIQADLAADPIKLLAFARAVLAASGEKT